MKNVEIEIALTHNFLCDRLRGYYLFDRHANNLLLQIRLTLHANTSDNMTLTYAVVVFCCTCTLYLHDPSTNQPVLDVCFPATPARYQLLAGGLLCSSLYFTHSLKAIARYAIYNFTINVHILIFLILFRFSEPIFLSPPLNVTLRVGNIAQFTCVVQDTDFVIHNVSEGLATRFSIYLS